MDRNKTHNRGGARRGAPGGRRQPRNVSSGLRTPGRVRTPSRTPMSSWPSTVTLCTRLTRDDVKLVKWPAETQVPAPPRSRRSSIGA